MSSLLNVSSLISSASGAKSLVPSIAKNFDPSQSRLAASGLIKGGASLTISGISNAIGSSPTGALGKALGGPLGGVVGGPVGNSISGSLNGTVNNAMGGLNGAMGGLSSAMGGIGGALNGTLSSIGGSLSGSSTWGIPGLPNIAFGRDVPAANGSSSAEESSRDWRIRVRCPAFGGATVIFPVLPTITLNYSANYSPQRLTHSNYASYFYESSEVQSIQITGSFPIQTVDEGLVLLNAINFFRATTKMFFGSSPDAGNPPPLVILDGYGKQYLNNVTCVVTAFQHTMPNDVDYIDCNGTRLPTYSDLQVTLQPIVSRAKAGQFNLYAYANGWQKGFI